MPTNVVNFVEMKGNVVRIKDKLHVITYANPFKFFEEQILADCRITVDSKVYPLLYRGWRLCDDLKYRKRLDDHGCSGPHSSFELRNSETSMVCR